MKPGTPLRLVCALIGATMFAALPTLAQEKKPNIVFILVDNVGWGTFGVYGGTVPTPRIDQLASEGIRFNNYNVEVQCTPTRSAIHTGRYSVRSGTYTVPWPGQGLAGMSPWEYTIAKLLSDAGYATALYGKWHLGDVARPAAERSRLRRVVGHQRTAGTRRAIRRGRCSRRAACRCR